MRHVLIAAASFAVVTAVSPLVAHSQTAYPTKSIRFIVPVTTGGPSDIVARLLGERLSASLGKPVVVDNRPGASNTLGAALVAKAEPDGYTLLQAAANMGLEVKHSTPGAFGKFLQSEMTRWQALLVKKP